MAYAAPRRSAPAASAAHSRNATTPNSNPSPRRRPPARPEHPVNLAQTGVEIGKILEDLHGENGVELGVAIGRSRNIRLATFYPGELGAALLRRCDLVGADVDCADPSGRADKSRDLIRVIAAAAHL